MKLNDLYIIGKNANVQAFARVVREGESRQDDKAFFMRYGGYYDGRFQPPKYFESLERHPRIPEPTKNGDVSTAAGAFQATATTWGDFEKFAGHEMDFSRESQYLFYLWCLYRRGAIDAVVAGRFEEACRLCHDEWTSLPGGAEQNAATRSAGETYERFGGKYEGEALRAPDPQFNPDTLATEHYGEEVHESAVQREEGEMAPIAAGVMWALLKEAVGAVPQLASLWGKGDSEVAQRNVAAGTIVANALVKAVNAPNLQAAVDAVKADPSAAQAARAAIAEVWHLVEVGGGIEAARKAAAAAQASGQPMLGNPAFVISLVLVVMPFMLLVDVFYVHPASYVGEIRTQIVTGVLMVISIVGGFWLGTSYGSQRKTDILAHKE